MRCLLSRWIENYLPPLKAQLKEWFAAPPLIVFPECVAKLHAWPKRPDETKNPFKLLLLNNISLYSTPSKPRVSVFWRLSRACGRAGITAAATALASRIDTSPIPKDAPTA
jgi:hypothetical protein